MELYAKSQTVDPEVRAYVYSLVTAVGGRSTYDDSYSIGDDALAVLKDLTRWIRLYDEKTDRKDVKRVLAEANIVRGDLLEILALWTEDQQENKLRSKIALACLELLVPLTWPIELEDDKTTVNHLRHTPYLQLAQVGYKRAILHYDGVKILRTAVRIGLPSMAQPRRERSKRDEGIIKLVLYFMRNVAMITQPQHLPSQGDENEISRSSTIEAFHAQDIFSLLLTVGSSVGEDFQDQDVILLEILFHLLKGVDSKKLFMNKEKVSNSETQEFKELLAKEKAMLNGYKKQAPTRHNRFGTMIWLKRDGDKVSTVSGQNSITNESTTLHTMDNSKKWNKPKYRGKLTQEFNEHSDFGMRVELSDSARRHLRAFVEDFLDSGFGPLFASLRRAIEREAERVSRNNIRQYFYLIHWFLDASTARHDQTRAASSWHADRPTRTNSEENTFQYIASVLDQETFVLLNRHMQRAFDEKSWQDLQATLLCFTQILLTVQSMAESKDEEDQEIAENIQNRIFYEEATHDRIVQILRAYTNQGFAYLEAVTECVHVFMRMLERYSKENADLQIRSKRKARRKAKSRQIASDSNGANDDTEDAAEDEREVYRAVSERKFDFARFSAKFLSQPCVNTFISLLHFYRDLTPSQLKRCHRYLYRLAFKNELAVLLFRVDVLLLLQRMIKGPEGLPADIEGFKEWETLVQQIFRRCVKWLDRETKGEVGKGWKEAAVVEMLFSKIPSTLFYLQNGYERVIEKRAPRPPAELEIKRDVKEEKRVGVVVGVMLEQAKADALAWVKQELERAVQERSAWAAANGILAGRELEGTDSEQPNTPEAPSIFLSPDTDERKTALFKDKHLRLLLNTLGFQRPGSAEDTDASWILPGELSAALLKEALEQLQRAEFDPPTFEDGKAASDMVRNKTFARRSVAFDAGDSDGSGSGGEIEDGLQFPPNLREQHTSERPKKRRRLTQRNRAELTEDQAQERAEERRKREKERNRKIKSQLYITTSDDESDAEGDAEFFRLEEERRQKMSGFIRSVLQNADGKGGSGDDDNSEASSKKKRKRKAKIDHEAEEAKDRMMQEVDNTRDDVEMDQSEDEGGSALDSSRQPSPDYQYENYIDRRRRARELKAREEELLLEQALSFDEGSEDVDEREQEEDTPSTSLTALAEAPVSPKPLGELSVNTGNVKGAPDKAYQAVGNEDEEDEEPVVKPAVRRNLRAGFIIDDDSD